MDYTAPLAWLLERSDPDVVLVAGRYTLLDQSALDAVSQWEYRPYLLNNEPVEVLTEIEVNFALQ